MAIVDDKTTNYGLPLPHPDNHMAEDAERIRQSINAIDLKLKEAANAASSAGQAASAADAKAVAAQEAADAKLPLSGGTVTGPLNFANFSNPMNFMFEGDLNAAPAAAVNRNIFLSDTTTKDMVAGLQLQYTAVGSAIAGFRVTNKNSETGSRDTSNLQLFLDKKGRAVASAPHTAADAVGTEIVTADRLIAFSPMKLTGNTNIYVGGANASDTADLFAGRGFSAKMPFASLAGAIRFIQQNCRCAYTPSIILQADCSWGGEVASIREGIIIKSDSIRRKITLTGNLDIRSGMIQLVNLDIDAQTRMIQVYGFIKVAALFINSCNFTGTAFYFMTKGPLATTYIESANTSGTVAQNQALITSAFCGTSVLANIPIGAMTGKRYSCTNASRIIANGKADTIPGTEAGTKDASSTVC